MSTTAYHPLARALASLERGTPFSEDAREALLGLRHQRRLFDANRDIVLEGDRTASCHFLESGFVSRSKQVPCGERQILSFHMDGDFIDLDSSLIRIADHTVRTHAPSVMMVMNPADILHIAGRFPEIGRALWFDSLVDASIYREWSLNIGRRSAPERVAHLLLELGYRLAMAGLGDLDAFLLPISHVDFADALGITNVHVSRTLRWLRSRGLIEVTGRHLRIPDLRALTEFAGFNLLYLHPEGPRDANANGA